MRAATIPGLVSLALLLAGPPVRAQDGNVRANERTGASYSLPSGWSWQHRGSAEIAVQAPIPGATGSSLAVATLRDHTGAHAADYLRSLRQSSQQKNVSRTGLKLTFGVSLGGQRGAVEASYRQTVIQGEERMQQRVTTIYVESFGTLFEWTETTPEELASQAEPLFPTARKGLTLKEPADWTAPDKARTYVNQRVRYGPPRGWSWDSGVMGARVDLPREGKPGEGGRRIFNQLFTVREDLLSEKVQAALFCELQAIESTNTAENQAEQMVKDIHERYDDLRGFELKEKVRLRGNRAVSITFDGKPKNGGPNALRSFERRYVFKHKGSLFLWTERSPDGPLGPHEARFKAARRGLRFF